MTRQSSEPFDHISLNPTYVTVHQLVNQVDRGELLLDPPYQRGDAWTLDQRIALVQTWLRGLPAGVVILSDRTSEVWKGANEQHPENSAGEAWEACVDGKQRLTTACMWQHGEFAVPASWFPADYVEATEDTDDGPYVRHYGLTAKGRRFVERYASLLVARVRDCATVAEEAAFYLLVNGGGTPQSPADMENAARAAATGVVIMPTDREEYRRMREGNRYPGPCCETAGPVQHWPLFEHCGGGNGPGKPIRPHCTCDGCF